MEYKGYIGKVEFDDEAAIFQGEVVNTRDVLTFQGSSVAELKQAFKDSVDDYLAFCAERGEKPSKPNPITDVAPSLGAMLRKFVLGMVCLLLVTSAFRPSVREFPVVFTFLFATAVVTALFVGMISEAWLLEPNFNRRQVRLSWLFFLTAMVAIYLAWFRWLVLRPRDFPLSSVEFSGRLLFGSLFLPAIVFVGEPVVWFAVWWLRRWNRRPLPQGNERGNDGTLP